MKSKGFTLIELAVVLGIIAILAAIMTPLVVGYIDQARVTRAAADARAITTSLLAHKRDTARFPIYSSIANANTDTEAGVVLVGDGTILADAGGVDWTLSGLTTIGLDDYLNTNQLTLPTSARGGRVAYRGPYLNVASDPWNNAYLVTAHALKNSRSDHAFVISAGPNSTLETDRTQPISGSVTVGGDDIVSRIQ